MLRSSGAVFFVFVAVTVFTAEGVLIVNLGGKWNLKDANGGYNVFATVPGGVYSDLMDNHVIDNVFYGYNDVKTRWVSQRNWTYTKIITVNQDLYNFGTINLVFDGIDTFSEIYLNDVLIARTENMFVQYIFDVKSLLKVGPNSIRLQFQSPLERAKQLYLKQSKNYIVPPECIPDEYNGECHVNHIRKMQASFSWDWGPALPSMGIWKPAYLEGYNITVIRYITVDIKENSESDVWDITPYIYFSKPPKVYLAVIYANPNGEFTFNQTFSIPKLSVNLWWPNGYGKPYLYPLEVVFTGEQGSVITKTIKIGFRTVKLVQDPLTRGNSFYFLINNVPIFAKGSNSIPINILPEKGQDRDIIKFLLQSAKDVHMNMIRVWGGGVYESDTFYEICDELGLMIWQDFMFACSMYPTNNEFLSLVKYEVRHQVRRLQHHPCIVLWAGNNENEAALRQDWYGTSQNFTLYQKDYIQLYVNTVRGETLANDGTRPFLVSSPTNGIKSEQVGYIASNPQSEFYGDVHYYNYISDPWVQDFLPIARFSSEYGLQSLPSVATMRSVAYNASDLQYDSAFLQHRQHHPNGNMEMKLLISLHFQLPEKTSTAFYKAFTYYSQIIQAVGMKQQTEFYRIWRSNLNNAGQGLSMGALYWQLNDVWEAPSWSGIDSQSNWKMLHYHAKSFFSPIIITAYVAVDGNLSLYVVSDLLTNIYNATATISVYRWDSIKVQHTENINIDVLSSYSRKIKGFWINEYLSDVGCGSTIEASLDCFIYLVLRDSKGNKIAPDNYALPSTLIKSRIKAATVTVFSVRQIDTQGQRFEIWVKTDGIALFVWLDCGKIRGIFSDNGFLQVTEDKVVYFTAESTTSPFALHEALSVTHAMDPQYLA
ncbi:hypothetical protein Trydic_g4686 [Trypoxylus dichotomus]